MKGEFIVWVLVDWRVYNDMMHDETLKRFTAATHSLLPPGYKQEFVEWGDKIEGREFLEWKKHLFSPI